MAFEQDELNKRREARKEEQQFVEKQKKLLKIGVIMTAVTMVLCAGALLITLGVANRPAQEPSVENQEPNQNEQTPDGDTQEPPADEIPEVPATPDTVIHFVAGGDINITDKTVAAGAVASGYDYTKVFLDVAGVLGGADLSVLNLEGNLCGAPYGTQEKSAPQQMLQALRDVGVDFVQAANSYSIYNGLSGLSTTLQSLRQIGVEPLGAYASNQEFQKNGGFVIRQVQGIRVAVVAFTKGMDGMGLPAGSEDCINLLYEDYNSTYQKVDKEGITAVMEAIQDQKPDVTIALLHWGSEFNSKVSKTQTQIRDLLLELGADAIIGTHSHYVQTMEFDKEKGTLVAYSLGDFLGDGEKAGTDYSVLLDLEIRRDGETGKVSIADYSYTPIYLQDETETGGGLKILRVREAITAYEQNFVGKVSESTYLGMKNALEKVDGRFGKE